MPVLQERRVVATMVLFFLATRPRHFIRFASFLFHVRLRVPQEQLRHVRGRGADD